MSLSKITQWVLIVLMSLSVVVTALFFLGGTGEEEALSNPHVDLFLNLSFGLAVVGVVATLLLSIFNFVRNAMANPAGALKGLIGPVLILVVVGISYSVSDDTLLQFTRDDVTSNTPGWLKFADTLFYTLYALLSVAILAVLGSSILKIFR